MLECLNWARLFSHGVVEASHSVLSFYSKEAPIAMELGTSETYKKKHTKEIPQI